MVFYASNSNGRRCPTVWFWNPLGRKVFGWCTLSISNKHIWKYISSSWCPNSHGAKRAKPQPQTLVALSSRPCCSSLLWIITAMLRGIHASPHRQGKTQLLLPAPSPGMGFQDGVPAPFDGEAASEQLWPVAWEGPTVSFSLWAAEAFYGKRIMCCILSQGKFKAGGGQFRINSNILWVFSSFKRWMFLCWGENVYFFPPSSYLVLSPPRFGRSCADW